MTIDEGACLDQRQFLGFVMDKHHVGITTLAGIQRLPGTLRHHPHVDPGLVFEQRQDVLEQARIFGGCRRRNRN